MLGCRVQSQSKSVIAEGFPGFSYLLRINSLTDTWAYSIPIKPILSSCPSNLGPSFPFLPLHRPPPCTVSFDFVTKTLALLSSSNPVFYPSESPQKATTTLFSFLSSTAHTSADANWPPLGSLRRNQTF